MNFETFVKVAERYGNPYDQSSFEEAHALILQLSEDKDSMKLVLSFFRNSETEASLLVSSIILKTQILKFPHFVKNSFPNMAALESGVLNKLTVAYPTISRSTQRAVSDLYSVIIKHRWLDTIKERRSFFDSLIQHVTSNSLPEEFLFMILKSALVQFTIYDTTLDPSSSPYHRQRLFSFRDLVVKRIFIYCIDRLPDPASPLSNYVMTDGLVFPSLEELSTVSLESGWVSQVYGILSLLDSCFNYDFRGWYVASRLGNAVNKLPLPVDWSEEMDILLLLQKVATLFYGSVNSGNSDLMEMLIKIIGYLGTIKKAFLRERFSDYYRFYINFISSIITNPGVLFDPGNSDTVHSLIRMVYKLSIVVGIHEMYQLFGHGFVSDFLQMASAFSTKILEAEIGSLSGEPVKDGWGVESYENSVHYIILFWNSVDSLSSWGDPEDQRVLGRRIDDIKFQIVYKYVVYKATEMEYAMRDFSGGVGTGIRYFKKSVVYENPRLRAMTENRPALSIPALMNFLEEQVANRNYAAMSVVVLTLSTILSNPTSRYGKSDDDSELWQSTVAKVVQLIKNFSDVYAAGVLQYSFLSFIESLMLSDDFGYISKSPSDGRPDPEIEREYVAFCIDKLVSNFARFGQDIELIEYNNSLFRRLAKEKARKIAKYELINQELFANPLAALSDSLRYNLEKRENIINFFSGLGYICYLDDISESDEVKIKVYSIETFSNVMKGIGEELLRLRGVVSSGGITALTEQDLLSIQIQVTILDGVLRSWSKRSHYVMSLEWIMDHGFFDLVAVVLKSVSNNRLVLICLKFLCTLVNSHTMVEDVFRKNEYGFFLFEKISMMLSHVLNNHSVAQEVEKLEEIRTKTVVRVAVLYGNLIEYLGINFAGFAVYRDIDIQKNISILIETLFGLGSLQKYPKLYYSVINFFRVASSESFNGVIFQKQGNACVLRMLMNFVLEVSFERAILDRADTGVTSNVRDKIIRDGCNFVSSLLSFYNDHWIVSKYYQKNRPTVPECLEGCRDMFYQFLSKLFDMTLFSSQVKIYVIKDPIYSIILTYRDMLDEIESDISQIVREEKMERFQAVFAEFRVKIQEAIEMSSSRNIGSSLRVFRERMTTDVLM